MPERPKQASYANKYETKQTSAPSTSSSSSSKSKISSSKRIINDHIKSDAKDGTRATVIKPSSHESGRMVTYKSLDDIPDGMDVPIAPTHPAEKKYDDNYWNPTSSKPVTSSSNVHHIRHDDDDECMTSSIPTQNRRMASYHMQDDDLSDDDIISTSSNADRKLPHHHVDPIISLPMLPAELTAAKKSSNQHHMMTSSSSSMKSKDGRGASSSIIHHQPQHPHISSTPNRIESDQKHYYDISSSAIESSSSSSSSSRYQQQQQPSYQASMLMPSFPCESAPIASEPKPLPADPEKEKMKLFFSKEPRKVNYKPYSLEQYRMIKPKEYIEISNIKPDLNTDELVAKRANLQRVKEFARNLKQYNDTTMIQQPKLPAAVEQEEINRSMQKLVSKRNKALEFAKNVPKPKTKRDTMIGDDRHDDDGIMVDNSGGGMGMDGKETDVYGTRNEDAQRIAELELKHAQKRMQIDAIKKSMGMK